MNKTIEPIAVDCISQDRWVFHSWSWEVRNSIMIIIIIIIIIYVGIQLTGMTILSIRIHSDICGPTQHANQLNLIVRFQNQVTSTINIA